MAYARRSTARLQWLCARPAGLLRTAPSARRAASTGPSTSNRSEIDDRFRLGPRTAPGYLPVRFDITNLGEARVIEIVGQGTRFFRAPPGGHAARRRRVRQAVRLARGDRVRLTMPVPVFADNENIRFEIREDGRTLERFNYTGFQSRQPPGRRLGARSSPTRRARSERSRRGWRDGHGRARRSSMLGRRRWRR